ncbi:NADH dehydrogenase [ubiquinone] 1 alpha subcomplex assembly factor 3 [Osmia lignaria lignaria]|uniref:NADH dehydrogenase [ubiquinone] 1 alpha subcomplex assembly factor 3 n=1 Tax=Osmia lignaria lignaria TaxID=1437193 RepID=UPI0014792160|nr:NADH dehydrogenase [ubiquinone] 1 alpha subcomplex assembly factor 3 [Osmia lignaria]
MVLNNKLLTINQLLQNVRRFHCSKVKKAYEGSGKSTMHIINVAGPKLFITKCSSIGFQLSDNSMVVGPLAIFARTILCWNIACAKNISEANLSLFTALEPKLDVLILGLETKYDQKTLNAIKKITSEKNINTEILPVDQACGIYNFLCEEGRYVAAGLIPPLPEETHFYKKLTTNLKSLQKDKLIE